VLGLQTCTTNTGCIDFILFNPQNRGGRKRGMVKENRVRNPSGLMDHPNWAQRRGKVNPGGRLGGGNTLGGWEERMLRGNSTVGIGN
jgi:hypothetical protein